MRWRVFLVLLAIAVPGLAPSVLAVSDPAEMLADPAREARARELGQNLRCLVCQNNSVEESESDFARDMRRAIRERISAGEDDAQVTAWMVARYGDFVRLRPAFSPLTALLWASPLLALGIGGAVVLLARRRATPPPAPLSAAEAEAVRRLSGP